MAAVAAAATVVAGRWRRRWKRRRRWRGRRRRRRRRDGLGPEMGGDRIRVHFCAAKFEPDMPVDCPRSMRWQPSQPAVSALKKKMGCWSVGWSSCSGSRHSRSRSCPYSRCCGSSIIGVIPVVGLAAVTVAIMAVAILGIICRYRCRYAWVSGFRHRSHYGCRCSRRYRCHSRCHYCSRRTREQISFVFLLIEAAPSKAAHWQLVDICDRLMQCYLYHASAHHRVQHTGFRRCTRNPTPLNPTPHKSQT